MFINKIKELAAFVRVCNRIIATERWMFTIFIVLSILGALTEGVGVAMLAPILEGQSGHSIFTNIPFISTISSYFETMGTTEKLQKLSLVLGFIFVLRGMLLYSVEAIGGILPLRIQRNFFLRGYEALLRAEYSYFIEKKVGEHTNGLNDWAVQTTALLTASGNVIRNIILLLVYLSLMLNLSWKLAIFGGLFAFITSVLLRSFTINVLRSTGEELSEKTATVSELIFETIGGMKLIKTSAAEGDMLRRYQKALMEKISSSIRMVLYQSVTNPFLSTFSGIFICFLLFVGPYLNDGEEQWLGGLLMFLFVLMRMLSPVSQISGARAQIASNIFAFERLNNYFNETDRRKQRSGAREFVGVKREIAFENVSFQYSAGDKPTIKNLSLRIPAGKMVAVVGPSGSGKTTLVSLLTRFYDPQDGRITIDGEDISNIDVYDLRGHMSVVSQDIFIFNDTVANNLSFAAQGVTNDDIFRAAHLASADEFIDSLPEGYHTRLGDRGVRLSGGQQQRIAIARAVLRNPDLLIFDEATSHLDTFTEQAIQDAVEVLREGRTVLVIAHRLSTIRRADIVIVLVNGEIVEQGSHNELMAAKGAYWDMVNHQTLDLVNE